VVDSIVPTGALVAFARAFEGEHAAVELTLLTETLSAVTALVREKGAAFGIAGPAADFTGLERRHVGEVLLLPVCGREHALAARRGRIDEETLAGQVQIVLSERAGTDRETANQGILSRRTWRVVDLGTKHALLRGGLGWGNMPEHLIRDDLKAGALVTLRVGSWSDEEHRLSLSLARRSGAVEGPVARWAEERLSSLCRSELRGGTRASRG
jgi:DNA-binding transcriptional LysR family regulator